MIRNPITTLSLLVGLVAVAVITVGATQPSTKYFEVIDEDNSGKIRSQLNELVSANQSCSVVATVAPDDYHKAKIILECTR